MARHILITGGSGQVGSELSRRSWPDDIIISAPGRSELDLKDPAAIGRAVKSRPWAVVINAAAYTAVDRAETEIAETWAVNAVAPAVLAHETALAGIPLVHVSTDYVFDGSKNGAYLEDDPVCPINAYGASKEGGEQGVRTGNANHAIVRTSWLVSPHSVNFVKTMLRLRSERRVVRVVDDQHGCPTSATDLAEALATLALRMIEGSDPPVGTFHFVNAGDTTWCELARHVFALLRQREGFSPEVEAIATQDYPTPARRPLNSRLSTARIEAELGVRPRSWESAVTDVVADILTRGREQGSP